MIDDRSVPQLALYRRLESRIPVTELRDWEELVTPGINSESPVHRWFRFKEGFSAALLVRVIDELRLGPVHSILDPFCGVGTTLVAAQELKASTYAIGIERNPLISFIARTKIRAASADRDIFVRLSDIILRRSQAAVGALPSLSSLSTGRCMSRHMAKRILTVARTIRLVSSGIERDLLLLGLAACIEPLSKARRDGRALRIVTKPYRTLGSVLRAQWDLMAQDISMLRQRSVCTSRAIVADGDGRSPAAHGVPAIIVDLILTSPPYPNNIDYSEVYKLELWLLGYITSAPQFLSLRYSTFRSHPTCKGAVGLPAYKREVAAGQLREAVGDQLTSLKALPQKWRARVFNGYCADLWQSLTAHYRCLKPGGSAVYVLGNSLHGSSSEPYVIAADLLAAEMGKLVGFSVDRLVVARNLSRRLSGNHFLRESVVFLRK
jgi:DNA modification methylase